MNLLSFRRMVLLLSCLTFSLMALASSKQSYVAIGDMIQVNLPGETQLNQAFLVDRRGAIKLPEIGSIFVAGYSEEQLTSEVKLRLGEVYRDLTNVEVFIAQKQLIINVLGYVENPGEKVLDQATTIQEAFSAAGGIRSGAQLDKVQLKRGKTVTVFDYKQFLETGEESALPSLQSMDTLFVPASPLVGNIEQDFNPTALANAGDSASSNTSIKVFGEVNAPGSFSFKADTSLVDILMRSGGVTRYASVEQIRIISDNTPTLFNLKKYLDSGDSALLPILKPGSTVFVPKQEEEIKAGANVVYVMGEVAIPGAYEGKPGASFMDILANAGGPTRFAESRQIRIIKANGQVIRFDMVAYTEGSGSSPLPAIVSGDAIFVPEKLDMNEKSWLKVTPDRAVNVFGEVTRPGRIEWSDEMDLMDLLAHVGGPTLRADTTRIELCRQRAINACNILISMNLSRMARRAIPYPASTLVPSFECTICHKIRPTTNHNGFVKAQTVRFTCLVRLMRPVATVLPMKCIFSTFCRRLMARQVRQTSTIFASLTETKATRASANSTYPNTLKRATKACCLK